MDNFVSPLIYLVLMLVAGMITGIIAFRKFGYKIMLIMAPLTILGHYIYLAYTYSSGTYAIYFRDVVMIVISGPGVFLAFIGCFLGVYIKYKTQKGKNFTMRILEKKKVEN